MATLTGNYGGPSLTSEAPPSYSELEQKRNLGNQHGYPAAAATNPNPYTTGPYQQPVHYIVAAPQPTITAIPKPKYPGPHTFLIFTIVVASVCGFFNILSFALGMPAIICVAMATMKLGQGQYPTASNYSMAGLVLSIMALIFTSISWIISAGLIVNYTAFDGYRYGCSYLEYSPINGYSCEPRDYPY